MDTEQQPLTLQNREEFDRVLADYKPSDEAKQLLSEIPLVILLGITAAGRNTIINHLVGSGRYHFIVSDTTRPPKFRNGKMETTGVEYHFRHEDDVLEDLKQGRFLEAEVIHNQQVSGISIRELVRARDSGKIPINEVDVGGTINIRQAKPDTYFFFVTPPSYKEWMYRLKGREVMSEEETRNRLETARKVLEDALSRDDFIFTINDSSHRSAEEIDAYVSGRDHDIDNEKGRAVAREILNAIKQ